MATTIMLSDTFFLQHSATTEDFRAILSTHLLGNLPIACYREHPPAQTDDPPSRQKIWVPPHAILAFWEN